MTKQPLAAQAITQDMIAREARHQDSAGARATAAHTICERLHLELSRWVGADGCHALFARALSQVEASWPALESILLHWRTLPRLEGVPEAIQTHGADVIASALEATIVAVIELLQRLVGNDIALLLVKRSSPDVSAGEIPALRKRTTAMERDA
jgi:hypothetical protein